MNDKHKQVFVVEGRGDPDVGISPSFTTVTFESDAEFTDELIEDTKKMLEEWDDNGSTAYTQEEWDKIIAEEEEMYGK